jgi:hypothetical protein
MSTASVFEAVGANSSSSTSHTGTNVKFSKWYTLCSCPDCGTVTDRNPTTDATLTEKHQIVPIAGHPLDLAAQNVNDAAFPSYTFRRLPSVILFLEQIDGRPPRRTSPEDDLCLSWSER